MHQDWELLGIGTYNSAYINKQKTLVLKIQHHQVYKDSITDLPQRSARLWNEINEHLYPKAFLASTELGDGWVCPYIEGKQATDTEMTQALLDLYSRTGRVVIDAPAPNNFLRTHIGKIICVDIGLALQIASKEETYLEGGLKRRASKTSRDAWDDLAFGYGAFFYTHSFTSPRTVQTIKALLFIKTLRPDITDVTFLKTNVPLIEQLANAYDEQNMTLSQKYLKKLDSSLASSISQQKKLSSVMMQTVLKVHPISFATVQASCIEQLDRYIKSRGTIDIHGTYNPSWVTRLFKDMQRTTKKVDEAQQLKQAVLRATSLDELKDIFNVTLQKEGLLKTDRSGFSSRLGNCLLIINAAEKHLTAPSLGNDDHHIDLTRLSL